MRRKPGNVSAKNDTPWRGMNMTDTMKKRSATCKKTKDTNTGMMTELSNSL